VVSTVLQSDMEKLRQTQDSLDRDEFHGAVESVLSAKRVFILGVRSAAPLASFLGYYLNYMLPDVHVVTGDVFEQIIGVGEQDAVIAISFPRYSRRTLECMRLARESGATVIGLTDSDMSPLKEASHICLCAATELAGFVDRLAAPLSLINALVVAIGISRRGELEEHFKRLEGIWNAHSVYIDNAHE
jgi:DNA-binding MurR/RpiR family transcriptional regulator